MIHAPLRHSSLPRIPVLGILAGILCALKPSPAHSQTDDHELAPIHYSASTAADPVAGWADRLREGSLSFDQSSEKSFLKGVLAELEVPLESQVLVFSKTSLQTDRISPRRPRALYFSDEAYVGWVQGGDLEIISIDPALGPIFYRMTVPRPEARHSARVIRSRDCLSCHDNSRTDHVPGMLIRSVRPDIQGFPLLRAGTYTTDHTSPLSERWGGWFVTGTHAGRRHMGNLLYEEIDAPEPRIVKDMGNDLKILDAILDTGPYLRNTSDIVALMVLEHQASVHNALTKANITTRRMLHHDREMAKIWDEGRATPSETTRRVLESQTENLLREMLFADEFELESWGVEGDPAFQEAFQRHARHDSSGRSLRDFDLLTHLFENRLSYMIHSRSFEALPPVLKDLFHSKLLAALDDPKAFSFSKHLSVKDGRRIKQIVLETCEGLPPEESQSPGTAGP